MSLLMRGFHDMMERRNLNFNCLDRLNVVITSAHLFNSENCYMDANKTNHSSKSFIHCAVRLLNM